MWVVMEQEEDGACGKTEWAAGARRGSNGGVEKCTEGRMVQGTWGMDADGQ